MKNIEELPDRMAETKTVCCPLLIQSDTRRSWTVEGEAYTRSYMIPCLRDACAAYSNGECKRFGTRIDERMEAEV